MISWLQQRRASTPDHPCLRWKSKTYSYRDLALLVRQYGNALEKYLYKPGDRVLIVEKDPFEQMILILACQLVGTIPVPLDPKLPVQSYRQLAKTVAARLIISCRPELLGGESWGPLVIPSTRIQMDFTSSAGLLHVQQQGDWVAVILFTSGTTGTPKAVQLTFDNLCASAAAWRERLQFQPNDRYLLCLPLHHIGGLAIVARALQFGFFLVLAPDAGSETMAGLLSAERVSLVSLVPTMLRRLLAIKKFAFPESMRAIIVGGGPAEGLDLAKWAEQEYPVFLVYGMTETGSAIAGGWLKDWENKRSENTGDSLFIGSPFPSVELRIRNDEIQVRGPVVMKGYWGEPDVSDWFSTGDLGRIDNEGFLNILMRRQDRIVTGGENVNPQALERILMEHPAIKEAVILGVPDAEWGQIVVAFVETAEVDSVFSATLLDWCRRRVPGYMIPKQVVSTSEFPRTALGKIDRERLLSLLS